MQHESLSKELQELNQLGNSYHNSTCSFLGAHEKAIITEIRLYLEAIEALLTNDKQRRLRADLDTDNDVYYEYAWLERYSYIKLEFSRCGTLGAVFIERGYKGNSDECLCYRDVKDLLFNPVEKAERLSEFQRILDEAFKADMLKAKQSKVDEINALEAKLASLKAQTSNISSF